MLGLPDQDTNYYPPASFIKRELLFTAIACLKYYPSDVAYSKLSSYSNIDDKDVRLAVNKTLRSFKS